MPEVIQGVGFSRGHGGMNADRPLKAVWKTAAAGRAPYTGRVRATVLRPTGGCRRAFTQIMDECRLRNGWRPLLGGLIGPGLVRASSVRRLKVPDIMLAAEQHLRTRRPRAE